MHIEQALKNPIFKIISKCAETLGLQCYVVGGYVRDYILKRPPSKDIDIVAIGNGIKLAEIVSKALPNNPKVNVFKTYGTAMLKFEGIQVEFVGARKESYIKQSRNPQVSKGTIVDDQKRRDFTINAMAISLNKNNFGILLDPFNGIKDLKEKSKATKEQAMQRFCLLVLNLNEFLYLD